VIPTSKYDQNKTLEYARGFFYISDVKGASRIVTNQVNTQSNQGAKKENY
jgi:hypothetical protein